MEAKRFRLYNRLTASVVFVIAAVTYLLTIEPTASFWDCGEFIASSYKLEVGHPPGNPTFQLIARLFTLPGDNMHAAVLVNSMSAICSALTILLLYLTIVFFAKRLFAPGAAVVSPGGTVSTGRGVAIIGGAAVGALAYCFSDTFWFSAVEGEVYAMSSLFTALVFWAMTRWYETADQPYANRWIVLISFLMGLSIGVHLLNLLTIPALVFMYWYRKREDGKYTPWQYVGIMALSVVILALILFVIVPWMPKLAAYTDLLFVNKFGLPFNSGAAFFVVAVLALCFWGLFYTLRKGKAFANTALLCLTTIIIGFSIFSVCVIRSCVKTPTNEYQPDNAFTLVRYLSREQYGSTPLLYGQYFDAPYDLKTGTYWAPLDGHYVKVPSPPEAKYSASGKMLFPRMWSPGADDRYADFYESYMDGKGQRVKGATHKKPTQGANLRYFIDYQVNWMYWRYFMWNFVGRQNDIHSPVPGELFYGNWESGVKFIDDLRLGDQSDAPDILRDNKGKNHYYFLPLLLGLLGLFFQFAKDKRGCWLVFLMFFMTGLAIVVYLNQPPYQVRERDYAYAGSFYAFAIWIGFAVPALYGWITDNVLKKGRAVTAGACTALCLAAPAVMAAENWDDHDRSNRRTSVEMARNYLESVGPNGILITHGDNDTFPLWYAQEVEDVRTDVRICNTSLLGTDWHIDQMKYAVNKSAPLDLTIPPRMYLYGTNEYVFILDNRDKPTPIGDVMAVFKHPDIKAIAGTRKVDYICSRKILIPVNKDNALKSGIVPEKFADMIQDTIMIEIPKSRTMLSKPELFLLDLLSNYKWDRPLHMLNQGGDLNIGLKEYLMSDGYSAHLVPFKNTISSTSLGTVDTDRLYDLMTNVFSWEALARTDYYVDYQNLYTFLGTMPIRALFANCADAFMRAGEPQRAMEMLDAAQLIVKEEQYPLETICIGFSGNDYVVNSMVEDYFKLGAPDRARSLAVRYANELLISANFFLQFYSYAKSDFETCGRYLYYLTDTLEDYGEKELADKIVQSFETLAGGGSSQQPSAPEAS